MMPALEGKTQRDVGETERLLVEEDGREFWDVRHKWSLGQTMRQW